MLHFRYFVISRSNEPAGISSRDETYESQVLFSCIDLSPQRHHEVCIDSTWEAFSNCIVDSEQRSIAAQHWTGYTSPGGTLREADERAEHARLAEEMRSHIIRVATNRCNLLLSVPRELQQCRECFVFSGAPPEATECEVDISPQLMSVGATADFQCHRALVKHFNRIGAGNRSPSISQFDRDISLAEDAALGELEAVANGLSLDVAQYFPVELRDDSSCWPAVVRLDAGNESSYFGTIFVAKENIRLKRGMALVRVASVRCGTRLESFTSTLGIVK